MPGARRRTDHSDQSSSSSSSSSDNSADGDSDCLILTGKRRPKKRRKIENADTEESDSNRNPCTQLTQRLRPIAARKSHFDIASHSRFQTILAELSESVSVVSAENDRLETELNSLLCDNVIIPKQLDSETSVVDIAAMKSKLLKIVHNLDNFLIHRVQQAEADLRAAAQEKAHLGKNLKIFTKDVGCY